MHRSSNTFYREIILILISLLVLACFSAVSIAADEELLSEPSFNIIHSRWNTTLNNTEKLINKGRLNDESAILLREQINTVRTEAHQWSLDASDKTRELEKLVNALGPLPEEGEPAEASQVAHERRKLARLLQEAQGQAKQSDLISKRSDLLLREISTVEIDQMVSTLTRQDPLPLDPRIWIKAGAQFFTGYKSLIRARKVGGYKSPLLIILPVLVVGFFIAILAGHWVRRGPLHRFSRNPAVEAPPYRHRIFAAMGVAISRGVIPILIFTILCGIAWNYWMQFLLDPQFTWPSGIFYAVIFYLVGSASIRAIFSPRMPQWSLTCVKPDAARKISHRLNLLVVLIAIGIIFEAVLVDTGKAVEFGSVYAFIKNSLISVTLLFLSGKSLWQLSENVDQDIEQNEIDSSRLWFWPYLRVLTGLVAFTALICSILGFHNLADFLLPRIILTSLLAATLVALRVFLRDSLSLLLEKETTVANSLRKALTFDRDTGKRLNFWIMTLMDLIAILTAAYLLLVLWKFPHQDLVNWFSGWFTGISIGSYTFSLADVVLAFCVLFGVVALTRIIRAFLENRLFPQTSMDIGVRTAVSSGIGYAGILIALLLALSTLGIDLTKLALIAGALSVGIGFGLKDIVNNFVSGLILLFERPIKMGDWVVVGELEGRVKQINVRSTEIETFSRASVIIPNADLLQNAVVNWTHKSAFGRIEIPIGVAYDSDIETVEALLLECAAERSEILSWPAPFVYFNDFGDSSLDFQLYAFVDNIENRKRVSSEIRKSIMQKFREAEIEIPFPQTVVTMHQKHQSSSAPDED
ncbi:MAG: mechanosensitive ion channel domain-containing protein [Gammaproteobacteria bacterium]